MIDKSVAKIHDLPLLVGLEVGLEDIERSLKTINGLIEEIGRPWMLPVKSTGIDENSTYTGTDQLAPNRVTRIYNRVHNINSELRVQIDALDSLKKDLIGQETTSSTSMNIKDNRFC